MKLIPGLYEALITRDRAEAIRLLENLVEETQELSEESAPGVLARHIQDLLVKALRHARGDDKLVAQVELANRLVDLLGAATPDAGIDGGDRAAQPGKLLLSLSKTGAERLGTGGMTRPTLPLRHSDLIVNGPRDLRLGSEIRKELPSADRVDLLVAFLKWSGLTR